MKYLLVLAALLAVSWASPAIKKGINQDMVDFINNKEGGTWKAKLHSRFSDMDTEELKRFMGAKKRHENPNSHRIKLQPKFTGDLKSIPAEFDARTGFSQCADVIGTIPDQSACGSCWAVSSASVMSDRVCIGTNGKNKTPVSSIDLVSCCFECGDGCNGGWPDQAFWTWTDDGVVSGSVHKVDQFCKPYPFAECEHHIDKSTYPKCPSKIYKTPKCQKQCQAGYTAHNYKEDKLTGQNPTFYSLDNSGVQKEIMTNGPVVFTFDVYEDFVTYSSGVYRHTTGKYLGGHAVRAVGWGVDNGTPYWLIANSWNEDWGENGYFRMIRGEDDCGIEQEVSAATFQS